MLESPKPDWPTPAPEDRRFKDAGSDCTYCPASGHVRGQTPTNAARRPGDTMMIAPSTRW
eukprot:3395741-Lingulodinium_polyedra.AAC.1